MKTNKINVVLSLNKYSSSEYITNFGGGQFTNLSSGNLLLGAKNSKYKDGSKDQTKECKGATGDILEDYRFKPHNGDWGPWSEHPMP